MNVSYRVLRFAHHKYFSYLSTTVTVDYNQCIGKGEVSTMLDLSGSLIFRSFTITSSLVCDSVGTLFNLYETNTNLPNYLLHGVESFLRR